MFLATHYKKAFIPSPKQSETLIQKQKKLNQRVHTKSSVWRTGKALNRPPLLQCTLNNHQPYYVTDGLLGGSACNSRQHFIAAPSCSWVWCFQGDWKETFSAFANRDGGAAKTGNIFQAIFDLDVKPFSFSSVVDHKHDKAFPSSWDGELVPGTEVCDKGVAGMDQVARVALKAVTLLCFIPQF